MAGASFFCGPELPRALWTKAEFGCIINPEKTAVDYTVAAENNKVS